MLAFLLELIRCTVLTHLDMLLPVLAIKTLPVQVMVFRVTNMLLLSMELVDSLPFMQINSRQPISIKWAVVCMLLSSRQSTKLRTNLDPTPQLMLFRVLSIVTPHF